jgi:extradiol dioxygenase family protein
MAVNYALQLASHADRQVESTAVTLVVHMAVNCALQLASHAVRQVESTAVTFVAHMAVNCALQLASHADRRVVFLLDPTHLTHELQLFRCTYNKLVITTR